MQDSYGAPCFLELKMKHSFTFKTNSFIVHSSFSLLSYIDRVLISIYVFLEVLTLILRISVK